MNYPFFLNILWVFTDSLFILDRNKADCMHSSCKLNDSNEDSLEPCSNKMIQVVIVILVFIMAIW